MYLEGEQVKLDSPTIKSLIGTKVIYLRNRDIDKTGRGYFYPRYGIITDVLRKQVEFNNNQDYGSIRDIVEMVIDK